MEEIDYKEKYSKYFNKMIIKKNKLIVICPFHDDHNPSLHIKRDTGQYYCHSCKDNGNFIVFENKINGNIEIKQIPKNYKYESFKPYSLEKYSDDKKIDITYLKSKWKLYNDKNRLVIPYYDELGNLLYNKYRYANKRFSSDKNIELSLYGLENTPFIKQCGYVVLVEGESDVHTLSFFNVPVLGVPGANNFKQEWVDKLKGLTIYLFKESDQAGMEFIKDVLEKLHKKISYNQIKIVCGVPEGAKDPSAIYLESLEQNVDFKERWKKVMNDAFNLKEKELPINFVTPNNYIIDINSGVILDKGKKGTELISRTPIILGNRLVNEKQGYEKVKIYYYRDSQWKELILARNTLFSTSGIMTLAEYGITVTTNNASKIVKYLETFEAENYNSMGRILSTNQYGWYGKNFIPILPGNIIFDADEEGSKRVNAYKQEGRLEDWLKGINALRKNVFFRFFLAGAFAAPLLKLLNCRSFIINVWSTTGSGKTAALKCALSAWGNPEQLMITFNSTTVGLERTASYYNDLPLGIDEKQHAKGKQDVIDGWIYMIAGELGKVRGTVKGLQATTSWRTVALTTAEEPLVGTTSHGGVLTRVVDLFGEPFFNSDTAKKVHEWVRFNHGSAAPIYLKELIDKYLNNIEELKKLFNQIDSKLRENNSDKISSNITSVAITTLADYLLDKFLNNVDDIDNSITLGRNIIDHLNTNKEADLVERAYRDMNSWCYQNENYFLSSNFNQVYGKRDNNDFLIFPSKFKEALKELGYNSPVKIIKGFIEKKYIKQLQTSSKDGTSVVRNGNKTQRFIIFVPEDIKEQVVTL